MANVANTKATGPASKDTVSGGKTFTPRFKAQTGPTKCPTIPRTPAVPSWGCVLPALISATTPVRLS